MNEFIEIRKKRENFEKEISKLKEKKVFLQSNLQSKTDLISIIQQNSEENKKTDFEKFIEIEIKKIEKKIKEIEKENKEIIKLCNNLEDIFEGYISFIHQIELLNFYSNY